MISFNIIKYPETKKVQPHQQHYTTRTMGLTVYNEYISPLDQLEIEDEITRCVQIGFLKGTSFIKKDKTLEVHILGFARHKVEMPKVIVAQTVSLLTSLKDVTRFSSDELLLDYDQV